MYCLGLYRPELMAPQARPSPRWMGGAGAGVQQLLQAEAEEQLAGQHGLLATRQLSPGVRPAWRGGVHGGVSSRAGGILLVRMGAGGSACWVPSRRHRGQPWMHMP